MVYCLDVVDVDAAVAVVVVVVVVVVVGRKDFVLEPK